MKFMKSTSSDGSKCAKRLAISGGMRSVTLEPVVAMMRAKACLALIVVSTHLSITMQHCHLPHRGRP